MFFWPDSISDGGWYTIYALLIGWLLAGPTFGIAAVVGSARGRAMIGSKVTALVIGALNLMGPIWLVLRIWAEDYSKVGLGWWACFAIEVLLVSPQLLVIAAIIISEVVPRRPKVPKRIQWE